MKAFRIAPPRRARTWAAAILTTSALVCVAGAAPAEATAGDLDTTFGDQGRVRIHETIQGTPVMALDGDKSVVAVTMRDVDGVRWVQVNRRMDDGSPDATFGGGDGAVVTRIRSDQWDAVTSVVVTDDRKIVVGGTTSTVAGRNDFFLVRYEIDGDLDETFGDGGITVTPVPDRTVETARLAVLSKSQELVVAGTTQPLALSSRDFTVARYGLDGHLVADFGDGGMVSHTYEDGYSSEVMAVRIAVVDSYPTIVVAGRAASAGTQSEQFAVARILAKDGALDNRFGSAGVVLTDVVPGLSEAVNDLAVQADGNVVAAGWVAAPANGADRIALARYTVDGKPDPTFGARGTVLTTLGERANAIVLQPVIGIGFRNPARIVVVGYDQTHIALVRFLDDGSVDETFGILGKVHTEFEIRSAGTAAGVRDSDHKIVVAGVRQGFAFHVGMTRYLTH